jgi:protein TonB
LNCSSDYYSSNDINFSATSLSVTPVLQEEESVTSEATQVVSPELESLLESKLGLDEEIETNLKEEKGDEIFTSVEQQAEFPGGPRAFGAFLQKNLRYPSAAQRANVGGKVYVQFVVNTDGSIEDLQILKSVGFGCDDEAIRIIKLVPRWTPGKQSGRPVRSRFTQPITFVLSE